MHVHEHGVHEHSAVAGHSHENVDHETFHYMEEIADNLEEVRKVHSLAIPSDLLIFNLMRACVGIK